jgi:ferritin
MSRDLKIQYKINKPIRPKLSESEKANMIEKLKAFLPDELGANKEYTEIANELLNMGLEGYAIEFYRMASEELGHHNTIAKIIQGLESVEW